MIRRELYCDGHLVKEFDQINVGGADTDYRDHYVDGLHTWLLDGAEVKVTDADAEAFRASWAAQQEPRIPTEG